MFDNLFSKSGLSLDRLRTFCQIVEARSIAKAAAGDSNKQSKFSHQLKELEEFFGTELVRRRGDLTEAGSYLFAVCLPLLNSLNKVAGDISGTAPEISIGSGEAVLDWVVFPKLPDLRKVFPSVTWKCEGLRTIEINEQLLQCRLDFGILRREACSSKLRCTSLGMMTFALFVPSAFSAQEIPTASLASEGKFEETLKRIVPKIRPRLKVKMLCSSFPSVMAALQSGAFAAILPLMAKTELASGRFRVIERSEFRELDRKYVLAVNPRAVAMRPFLQKIEEELVTLCRLS